MNLNTQVVSLFQTTKQERQNFAIELAEKLNNGELDPLTLHLQVKCMEDVVKQVTTNNNYKKAVTDAAERYGQKSFEFHNAKFEIKETGVKYDYSKCADPVLFSINSQLDELSEKLKQREAFLKSVPEKGMIITDDETGETFTVYPPSKSSTTSVAVTLK